MDVNDNAGNLNERVVSTAIASKLAPTRSPPVDECVELHFYCALVRVKHTVTEF